MVERVKRNIIKLYREDIAKYAENYIAEAKAVFHAIPAQLIHYDKKIKYSSLQEGDCFTSCKDALFWIQDSMVGNLCYGLDEPIVFDGFSLQTNKIKCYMADTGLLLTLAAGDNYLRVIFINCLMLGKLSVNKDMMTENIVAQMLTANHHPLCFYEKTVVVDENKRKKYEIDFLLADEKQTIPLEVKSGYVKVHSSLDYFCKVRSNANISRIVLLV